MSINLELLDLRAYLALYDIGSFHEAAELLNLSQPALSRRLKRLEARLGTPLLERTTRHVAPTAAGRKLEPVARRLLDEIDATLLSIKGIGERQSGQLTIASIPAAVTYFLPKVIKEFNNRFPLIRVRVLDRTPQEGLESVIRGEVEFGINMIGATEEDVKFTRLLNDPYVLACRRDHALAGKKNVTWHDLAEHPLIRIGRADSGNRALLDSALATANIRLNWFYEVNNLTTSLALVEAGLGASVVPRLATPHPLSSAMVIKPIRAPEITRAIGIVERRKGRMSPTAVCFRDILLEDLNRLAESKAGSKKQPRR